MPIDFPPRALAPPGSALDPAADVLFYRILKEHPELPDFSVEFGSEPSRRTPPWVRVAVVRYLEPHSRGESTPIASLDVYAEDGLAAGDIARSISTAWPYLKKVTVPGEGYVSGAWVEVEAYRLDEPADAENASPLARFHLEVGLRIHPEPQGAP